MTFNVYQNLLPDLWSECLSYLPPTELSSASEVLLIKEDAEHAAWLSVFHMVEIAEKYWQNTTPNSINLNDQVDTRALELERLVCEDTTNSNLARLLTPNRVQQHQKPTRFRDETWQNLYGFLYSLLSEAYNYEQAQKEEDRNNDNKNIQDETNENTMDNDAFHDGESIALVVGLVFGAPCFSRLTPHQRKKLKYVSLACKRIVDTNGMYTSSQGRCYKLALLLADEGFWDEASSILQTQFLQSKQSNILSVDGRICVSTFLIDRMYSQTYVQHGRDDDDLAKAVRLGRRAVNEAQQRCESDNLPTETTETAGAEIHKRLPPPPMESLFENDVDRLVHAKLALGKALSLLAQHIGLGATEPNTVGVSPELTWNLRSLSSIPCETPEMIAESQVLWANISWVHKKRVRKRIAWTRAFFEESRQHFEQGLRLQRHYALLSAEGERLYCAASASTAFSWTLAMEYFAKSSIVSLQKAFANIMEQAMHQNDPKILDSLIRCGKDYGKTCGFCDAYGVDYEQEKLDPKLVFEFAYLVSIYRYGSFHPTTKNVERLAAAAATRNEISPSYARVRSWLEANFDTP